jgi:hypothetical protein
MGDHATKQEVLQHLLLLIIEGTGRRPRQAAPLEPIDRPTPVTGHQPREELAVVWCLIRVQHASVGNPKRKV